MPYRAVEALLTVAAVPTRRRFGVNALHLEAADLAERSSVNVHQRDVEEGLAVSRLGRSRTWLKNRCGMRLNRRSRP